MMTLLDINLENKSEKWGRLKNICTHDYELVDAIFVDVLYVKLFDYFLVVMQNDDDSGSLTLYAFDIDDIDAMIDHSQNKGKIPNDPIRFKHDKKYQIGKKIGSGATSIVYNAVLNERQLKYGQFRKVSKLEPYQVVIVKQQNQIKKNPETSTDNNGSHNEMIQEKEVLETIRDNKYICDLSCRLIECFMENGVYHLVLTKLGVTLQQLFNLNGNRFSIEKVAGIMNQMIGILFQLHSIGFVHNDIKPENILIGNDETNDINKLYLIDFGIAKPFWNFKNDKHFLPQRNVPFEGTFRFSSLNHHCYAMNQSRRDDLESLIYVAIYFLNPRSLPWYNIDTSRVTRQAEIFEMTKQLKFNSSVDFKYIEKREAFEVGLDYVRNLEFDEMPDYLYLQSLFQTLLDEQQASFADLYNPTLIHKIRARITKNVDYSAMNNKMIDKYIKNIPLHSDRTKYNNQTHYSVHGLINRSGYNIQSIVISRNGCGIPLEKPKEDESYGGMIIYEDCGNNTLKGRIYMLEGSLCKAINDKYYNDYKQPLNGAVHGAIYYHYFKKDVDRCDDSQQKKQFIRGFAVYGKENDVEFKFNSGAFNKTGLQLRDDKYRQLPQTGIHHQWQRNNQ